MEGQTEVRWRTGRGQKVARKVARTGIASMAQYHGALQRVPANVFFSGALD